MREKRKKQGKGRGVLARVSACPLLSCGAPRARPPPDRVHLLLCKGQPWHMDNHNLVATTTRLQPLYLLARTLFSAVPVRALHSHTATQVECLAALQLARDTLHRPK